MASLPEFMLQLAEQQGKNIKQNTENAYLPEYMALTNLLKREEIPETQANTAHLRAQTSMIPSQIEQNLAGAQYNRAQASRVPFLNRATEAELALAPIVKALKEAELRRKLEDADTPDYQSPYGKALGDAERIKRQYGEKSNQYMDAQRYAQNLKNGSGSRGGAKGGLYVDPQTGAQVSMPTTVQLSRLQLRLDANRVVQENLTKLIDGFSPYLGWQGQGSYVKDKARTYVQGDKAPKEITTKVATRESAEDLVKTGAESLLREAGLNVTNQTVTEMQSVLRPRRLDSPATYKERVLLTLEHLRESELRRIETLKNGYLLNTETGDVVPGSTVLSISLPGEKPSQAVSARVGGNAKEASPPKIDRQAALQELAKRKGAK